MSGTVVVVGAAGRLGRAVVRAARGRGLAVREIDRTEALRPGLLAGADAILCAIGPAPGGPPDGCARGTAALVDAARAAGAHRLVVVTGALIGHPRERLSRMYRMIDRMQAKGALDDRRAQERIVRESGLDWTLVRPPRLTEGAPTGAVVAGEDVFVGALARVDREDLARFLLDVAADRTRVGRSPTVLSA